MIIRIDLGFTIVIPNFYMNDYKIVCIENKWIDAIIILVINYEYLLYRTSSL